MGTDLVPKQTPPTMMEQLVRFFWLLVLWVGFPGYVYYLSQDVDTDRFLKAMGAILTLVLIYYVIVYLLWMYSGTKVVAFKYILGTLTGLSGIIYVGLLFFLAKRGRHYNEVAGGRRKRH